MFYLSLLAASAAPLGSGCKKTLIESMDTIIRRLFQHLVIILISIMSIFNVSFTYLIDANDEDDTNEHGKNTINESIYKYSEEVTEILLDPIFLVQ
ncbi:unnamed protein product, partial [Rotaria socialis]